MPFQIKSIFFSPTHFPGGKFNPYLSFHLYLNDLLLFSALFSFGLYLWQTGKKLTIGNPPIFIGLIFFFLLLEISSLFSSDKIIVWFTLVRFLELMLIYLLLVNDLLPKKQLFMLLLIALGFQTILGLIQYLYQNSLHLSFLGEPILSAELPGVAKINFGASKFIRAYGTFPHPNILAGFLLVGLFLALFSYPESKLFSLFLIALLLAGLIVTFSRSALIALLLGITGYLIYLFRKNLPGQFLRLKISLFLSLIILFSLVVFFSPFLRQRFFILPKTQEWQERLTYSQISLNLILKKPFGLGLNSFTSQMANYAEVKLQPWEYQPVHNVFLLISNEVGLPGGILLLFLFIYAFRVCLKNKEKFLNLEQKRLNALVFGLFLSLLVLFQFDHYFLTLYQGQILFIFLLSLLNSCDTQKPATIKKIN